MIDILDHRLDHHQDDENAVVGENIVVVVVDIRHHHQVLPIQVHRLIVHVRLPVVHIEDIDVDDQVRLIFFSHEMIVRTLLNI